MRSTPAARFFADKWLEKLLEGAEQNITWMRDQPAFNLMARGMGKADVNFTAPERPGDRALLLVANGTTKLGVRGQGRREMAPFALLQTQRSNQIKSMNRIFSPLLLSLSLSVPQVLPPGQFMSGHVYFVQATPAQRAAAVAVHATFQFGDTDAFAYGKRTRLRQHGLWLAPEEAGYGRPRLLVLRDAPLFPTSDVKDEATNTTDATLDLLEKHFAADLEWRTRLQAGLAAARVLNRTLVVPR